MAYNVLADANISLATASSERVGYGVPLFIGNHSSFSERVRTYTKLTELAADVSTDSAEYRAGQSAFSQSNGLGKFMLGRRRSSAVLSPTVLVEGTVHTATVGVNDGDSVALSATAGNYLTDCSFLPTNVVNTSSQHQVTITVNDADAIAVNVTAGADEEAVVDLMVTAINGNANVAGHVTASKVGTGTTATLRVVADTLGDFFIVSGVNANLTATKVITAQAILTELSGLLSADAAVIAHVTPTLAAGSLTIAHIVATDEFTLSNVSGLNNEATSTESASTVLAEIDAEDDGYYFVTAQDKTQAFVLDMATAVQAKEKQYWVSIADADSYAALTDPATDILGLLRTGDFSRTVGIYHQDATTDFKELAAIAFNSPFESGTVTWSNLNTGGVAASANATTGKKLSAGEKSALSGRNAQFWDISGGIVHFSSDVKTMSGERPENIRGRDNMVSDMVAALRDLMLSQTGGKVTYTNRGIAQIENVVSDVLSKYSRRSFIEDNFRIVTPDINEISASKRGTQIFDELTFVAQLSGAITMVSITGSLQLSEVAA